jgi:hypothetical protein
LWTLQVSRFKAAKKLLPEEGFRVRSTLLIEFGVGVEGQAANSVMAALRVYRIQN